jgi:hypothetical protein
MNDNAYKDENNIKNLDLYYRKKMNLVKSGVTKIKE